MNRYIPYTFLIMFLFSILSIGIVSADDIDPRYNFRKATVFDITDSCYNNNSYCLPISQCNITITFSNNTPLVNNALMSNASYPLWKYTLNDTQTQTLGLYETQVICLDQGSYGDPDIFYFEISQTGTEPSVTEGIIYFIAILLGIFLFALSLYGAIRIPWRNERNDEGLIVKVNDLKYVKLFLWFGAYMMLIMITFLAYNITWGFLSFELAGNIFNVVYWILISGLFPIIVIGLIVAITNFITDKELKKDIDRGLQFR